VNAPQEGNVFLKNEVRNAALSIAGVFVDSSAQAQHYAFVKNTFEVIDGDGFLLMGDNNLLEKNHFEKIGGQNVVDLGVGTLVEIGDQRRRRSP
jgi:hypothetical protein